MSHKSTTAYTVQASNPKNVIIGHSLVRAIE